MMSIKPWSSCGLVESLPVNRLRGSCPGIKVHTMRGLQGLQLILVLCLPAITLSIMHQGLFVLTGFCCHRAEYILRGLHGLILGVLSDGGSDSRRCAKHCGRNTIFTGIIGNGMTITERWKMIKSKALLQTLCRSFFLLKLLQCAAGYMTYFALLADRKGRKRIRWRFTFPGA